MRISTRYGAPTPDDLDELLALVWKKPSFFLAHPKAIAAFERECTWPGEPPVTVSLLATSATSQRGKPLVGHADQHALWSADAGRSRRIVGAGMEEAIVLPGTSESDCGVRAGMHLARRATGNGELVSYVGDVAAWEAARGPCGSARAMERRRRTISTNCWRWYGRSHRSSWHIRKRLRRSSGNA